MLLHFILPYYIIHPSYITIQQHCGNLHPISENKFGNVWVFFITITTGLYNKIVYHIWTVHILQCNNTDSWLLYYGPIALCHLGQKLSLRTVYSYLKMFVLRNFQQHHISLCGCIMKKLGNTLFPVIYLPWMVLWQLYLANRNLRWAESQQEKAIANQPPLDTHVTR